MTIVTGLGALLIPFLAGITVDPDPVLLQLGPLTIPWYGTLYAVGLTATYLVVTREARRVGLDAQLVDNGIVVVAIAALIGGRAYHVIHEWERYANDPLTIILPPYSGLGVYGGILTGLLAVIWYTRRHRAPFWRWADVVAPGLFVMQAIGRWGNFFNQELYGPPTGLPWGITIGCDYRTADVLCDSHPFATTFFHPLFLYESVSAILGAVTLLFLARRFGDRLRPGDLALIFFIWYAAVRFFLETFRTGNWTIGGIPTAMLISGAVIIGAATILVLRHRPGAAAGDPPPAVAAPSRPSQDDAPADGAPADRPTDG